MSVYTQFAYFLCFHRRQYKFSTKGVERAVQTANISPGSVSRVTASRLCVRGDSRCIKCVKQTPSRYRSSNNNNCVSITHGLYLRLGLFVITTFSSNPPVLGREACVNFSHLCDLPGLS